ncbi:MAG: DNA translocase FtsK [Clostridia bacterium]|nr:DNA translocase FtsK [Clostridia bacterium]
MCLKNLRRSLLVTNISAFSLVANFCGILHLFNFKVENGGFEEWRLQFVEATKSGWDIGISGFSASGGTLGAIFGGVPLHLFGKAGAFIVIIFVFIVSLFLYLNTDINLLGEKLSEFAVNGKGRLEESNEQRKIRAEERRRIRQEEKLLKIQQQAEQAEAEEDSAEEEVENEDGGVSLSLPSVSLADESKEETVSPLKDAFDFDKTEIEYDPISKGSAAVSFDKTEKHVFPQNNVFTYPDGKVIEKAEAKPADKSAPARPFADDLISMGRGASKNKPVFTANSLPDDFEEIDDGVEFEVSVEKAEDVKLSDNDKAVVEEAVKDAETKLEKTKAEVRNYKETRKPQKAYKLPSIEFLNKPSFGSDFDSEAEMRTTAKKLVDILKSFGVETTLIGASRGPSVTRYELSPAPGVKISRITSLADDIALGLASTDVRIEAPIPNKAAVGIEVPNKKSSMVTLREVISSKEYKESQGKLLTVALGKDIAGNIRCTDLAKMPHLLIAGTTGSGKSVCLNCMIASVLYNATPDQVKLLMIDPKQVEFSVYNGIPHLLVPVITDARKAAGSLAWAVGEMDSRYKTFSTCGVRDIKSYNNYIKDHPELPFMPQVVIFIDELNDLMMVSPKEVEDSICRLAQKARAAGMHLVVATQRPSVDVITGIIKANIPSRLSLAVSSQVDSRTILDSVGAEKLLGNGDMLFNPVGVSKPVRIQGAYLSDGEIEKIVDFIKNQTTVTYDDEIMQEIEKNATAEKKKGSAGASSDGDESQLDALIEEAMNVVTELNSASTTVIQRKLSVGYARAARIMDQLEQLGYVSPAEGNKPRKVLISRAQFLEMKARGETSSEDYDVLSD